MKAYQLTSATSRSLLNPIAKHDSIEHLTSRHFSPYLSNIFGMLLFASPETYNRQIDKSNRFSENCYNVIHYSLHSKAIAKMISIFTHFTQSAKLFHFKQQQQQTTCDFDCFLCECMASK